MGRRAVLSDRQTGEHENGDVIVLTKIDSRFHCLVCTRLLCEECTEAIKAVEFAGRAAGFEQAVRVEGKVVTFGATAPLGRPGQPAELAGIYVRLAEDDGSYTTGNIYGAGGGQGNP